MLETWYNRRYDFDRDIRKHRTAVLSEESIKMNDLESEKEYWRVEMVRRGFKEVTKALYEKKESTSNESRKIQLKVNNEEGVLYFLK